VAPSVGLSRACRSKLEAAGHFGRSEPGSSRRGRIGCRGVRQWNRHG